MLGKDQEKNSLFYYFGTWNNLMLKTSILSSSDYNFFQLAGMMYGIECPAGTFIIEVKRTNPSFCVSRFGNLLYVCITQLCKYGPSKDDELKAGKIFLFLKPYSNPNQTSFGRNVLVYSAYIMLCFVLHRREFFYSLGGNLESVK